MIIKGLKPGPTRGFGSEDEYMAFAQGLKDGDMVFFDPGSGEPFPEIFLPEAMEELFLLYKEKYRKVTARIIEVETDAPCSVDDAIAELSPVAIRLVEAAKEKGYEYILIAVRTGTEIQLITAGAELDDAAA